MNEIDMQNALQAMSARITVIEAETVPVVKELQAMRDSMHEVVEILRDIKGSLKVLSFVAKTSKKFTQVGLVFIPFYLFWEDIKAFWNAHSSGRP